MPASSLSDDGGAAARALRVPFRCAPGGNPVLGAPDPVPAADVRPCPLEWSQCFAPGARGAPAEPTCSCGHLAYPLGPDAPLPDHICVQTMRVSVWRWATAKWLTDVWDGTAAPRQDWPLVEQAGRPLILVLQQWVRGKRTELLRPYLARHPSWQQFVDLVRRIQSLAEWSDSLSEAEAGRHGIAWSELQRRLHENLAALRDKRVLLALLNGLGLPSTPDILAHAWAVAAGYAAAETLERGLLVTTKAYAVGLTNVGLEGGLDGVPFRWEWDREVGQPAVVVTTPRMNQSEWLGPFPVPLLANVWFHDGHPSFAIEGDSALAPDELVLRANRKKQQVLEWLGRWRPGVITDRRERQRLLAAYDEPRSFSCLQEALDQGRIHALETRVAERPGALDELIREHLDASYRTVKEAARRAEREPIMEANWRATARAMLRPVLVGVISRRRVDN